MNRPELNDRQEDNDKAETENEPLKPIDVLVFVCITPASELISCFGLLFVVIRIVSMFTFVIADTCMRQPKRLRNMSMDVSAFVIAIYVAGACNHAN